MKPFKVTEAARLNGKLNLLGDKSIAHRAVIASALSHSRTTIDNFPLHEDSLSTVNALRSFGTKIFLSHQSKDDTATLTVYGRGLFGLKKPSSPIDIGESGTTFRLMLGVLAGQHFEAKLTAEKSLSRRPMRRVTEPLRMMGAVIKAEGRRQKAKGEEYPPLTIRGGNLKGITYGPKVASAQVKSAVLFAGLYAEGRTTVIEKTKTRDHTERMLRLFGAKIISKGNRITIARQEKLVSPGRIFVPADISSAAFFAVAASIVKGSSILLKRVSLNPGRTGVIRVLKRMGANIKIRSQISNLKSQEPMGDIAVQWARLKGTVVSSREVPSLIDELPVLMVAACFAKGRTVFQGVGELRVKETDRILSMGANLRKMGANIRIKKAQGREDFIITATKTLQGAQVRSFGDHRTAMSMIIAGLAASGTTRLDDVSCINKSFPGFIRALQSLK